MGARKVLFVLNSCGGGATQGIKELLETVSRKEIAPFVIVPNTPSPSQRDWLDQYTESWVQMFLPWWNLNTNLPFFYRYLVYINYLIKTRFRKKTTQKIVKLIDDWNIEVVYSGTVMIVEGAYAAKKCNVPHVWHLKETFGQWGRVKFPFSQKRLENLILNYSDRVIVMTEYIRSFFSPLNQSHQKIQVIYDAVNVEKFTNFELKDNSLRNKLEVKPDELLVGMVAALSSSWKNHKLVLKTAAEIKKYNPEIRFVAFGAMPKKSQSKIYNHPWRYYQKLKQIHKDLNLGNTFIWGGFHDNIPELMHVIDILIHPCAEEPFGRISIEALASGTPVIGPDTGGIAEVVVDNQTGILSEPDDVIAFTNAVKRLNEEEHTVDVFKTNARSFIKSAQHFNQDYHNQQIIQLLASLT